MNDSLIAGVDIGGSHITVSLIDLKSRNLLANTHRRVALDAQDSLENIIACWSKTIKESFSAHGIQPTKLGIAMPGPFNYQEGISLMKNQNKYDSLYGVNVKQVLAAALNINTEDISLANDAACFLQGELFSGVAKNNEKVIGLTLGTGLGSAWSLKGKAEDANLWCTPFLEGIAEDYLSTRWFTNRYFKLTGIKVKDVKQLVTLEQSDTCIKKIFLQFGKNLGDFLSPFMIQEGFELLVLGGNIAHALPLFSSGLNEVLLEKGINCKIEKSVLGEDAALAGAASFCLKEFFYVDIPF